MKIKIGLVDDHQLFLKSLTLMLQSFGKFEVVVEAINGNDLQQKLKSVKDLPDIMLIDVSMPVMDGVQTATWLNSTYPAIKLVALTMNDKEQSIIKMFKAGCSAYLLKDVKPEDLEYALVQVMEKGYYNSDFSSLNVRNFLNGLDGKKPVTLTPREEQFLQLACSELTYKQVAAEMCLSERTIDGYREALFAKFHVQSRVGLCLEALRNGLVSL